MTSKEKQQELMFKFAMFEQQINQLQEQLQAVEQARIETNLLNLGLDDLKDSKDKEILASIGKGILIKAKITSENLIVDIGGKNLVQKSVSETQNIIKSQIKKLEEIKKELEEKLEEVNSELLKIIKEVQEDQK